MTTSLSTMPSTTPSAWPFAWWHRANRWADRHRYLADAAFALVVGVVVVAGHLATDPSGSERGHDVWGVLLIVGQTIGLSFRRVRPWTSFAVVLACTVAFWGADYPSGFDVFTMLTVYAATVYGGDDRPVVWRRVGMAVAGLTGFAAVGVLSPTEDLPAVALVGILTIHLTAALIGQAVYDRRRRIDELQVRAERAEAEHELLARQAVLDERSRIARELHDVVAHGMSVIVVQAGAAERSLDRDPDAVRDALVNIQQVGRDALGEMRRMLGGLRRADDTADLAPQPGLADIDEVVRRCNQSGLPTALQIGDDLPPLSPGQDMAAFRVVQESLTNVLKHAGHDASASVHIDRDPDGVRIEVIDDGVGSSATEVAHSTGQGIVGMRERVEVFGGKLRAGPRPGGGFRVFATLPLDHRSGHTDGRAVRPDAVFGAPS